MEFMSPARDQPALCTLSRIHHPRPLWSSFLSLADHAIPVFMSGFTTFTSEPIAAAPQLEPSFEMTLRAADISEGGNHWIPSTQDQDHRDFDCDGYCRGRTQRNSSRSFWRRHCKVRSSPQGAVGQHSQRLAFSEGKSRGEIEGGRGCSCSRAAHPIPYCRLGVHDLPTQTAIRPAQSYFESFEDRLHNGVIEAETLAHVVSLEEERVQIGSKPELPHRWRCTSI